MSYEKNNHLDTDQIIRALVDGENLTSEEKFHFAACNICNNEKIKIEEQLFSLSQKAKNISPKPVRKIHLPDTPSPSFFLWKDNFKPALGVAFVTVLVLLFIWLPGIFDSGLDFSRNTDVEDIQETDQFMTEVGMLVEDSLPQEYQEILFLSETEFEEDLFQYIVPYIENHDPLSVLQEMKGEILC